jgi:hypothetical protein
MVRIVFASLTVITCLTKLVTTEKAIKAEKAALYIVSTSLLAPE